MATPLTARELTGQSVPDLNIPDDPTNRTTNPSGSDQRFGGYFANWDSFEAQVRETCSSQNWRYIFSKLQIYILYLRCSSESREGLFPQVKRHLLNFPICLGWELDARILLLPNDTEINSQNLNRDTVIAYRQPTAFATEQLSCTTEHSVVSRFNHNIGHFMTCVGRDLGMRLSFADWVSCFVI